jgi:Zn-finger nucleic acid-binding protein
MHDYDLNTACHNCFTRVSDKAKFCHSCGTGIATEDSIGNITDKACPACKPGTFLHTRQLRPDHPAVLECNHCVGLWLTNDYFEQVIKESLTAGENAIKPDDVQPHALETCAKRNPVQYRKCPDCSQFMARQNFARRSGVIVDSCNQHGRWFDAEELARILTWVEAGGMIKSSKANLAEEQAKLKEAKRQQARVKDLSTYDSRVSNRGSIGITLLDLLF